MADLLAKSFTVVAPPGNGYRQHPKMLFRVTDHFQDKGADVEFISKDGVPVQDDHGGFTLLAKNERAESLVHAILGHYGLMAIPN